MLDVLILDKVIWLYQYLRSVLEKLHLIIWDDSEFSWLLTRQYITALETMISTFCTGYI